MSTEQERQAFEVYVDQRECEGKPCENPHAFDHFIAGYREGRASECNEDAPWETFIKLADYLDIDPEEARNIPGKPSEVFIAAIEARTTECRVAEVVKKLADDMERAEGADADDGYMWDASECANYLRERADSLTQSAPQPEQAVRRDGISLEARHWVEIGDIIKSCTDRTEDSLSTEWRVEDCDRRGVIGDDDIGRHYPAVIYEAEYPEEGVIPIGDEIKPENPEQEQS